MKRASCQEGGGLNSGPAEARAALIQIQMVEVGGWVVGVAAQQKLQLISMSTSSSSYT